MNKYTFEKVLYIHLMEDLRLFQDFVSWKIKFASKAWHQILKPGLCDKKFLGIKNVFSLSFDFACVCLKRQISGFISCHNLHLFKEQKNKKHKKIQNKENIDYFEKKRRKGRRDI